MHRCTSKLFRAVPVTEANGKRKTLMSQRHIYGYNIYTHIYIYIYIYHRFVWYCLCMDRHKYLVGTIKYNENPNHPAYNSICLCEADICCTCLAGTLTNEKTCGESHL